MSDDAQLLQRFLEDHSEAAFSELVHRHIDLVHSAALRQVAGDAHRAQDVTQAVFCELASKAAALKGRSSLAGWLYTTARHVASRLQRGEQRRLRRELATHAMTEPLATPADDTPWEELRPILDEAMHDLAETDREAVVLRFFQNRSFAEVGTAIGLSENAARMRVDRALDKLRSRLSRRGVTSPAAILGGVLSQHAVTAAPVDLAAKLLSAAISTPIAAGSGVPLWLRLPRLLFSGTNWLVTGSTVALVAAILPEFQVQPPALPAIEVRSDAATPIPNAMAQTSTTPPNVPWRWSHVESSDYRQFIANLRADGAPEPLIRDVISLELGSQYLARLRPTFPASEQRPHWKKPVSPPPAETEEQAQTRLAVQRERAAVLQSLCGPLARPNDPANLVFCQPDGLMVDLAWLPRETAARAANALEPILELEQLEDQRKADRHGTILHHGSELKQRLERRLSALRDVLNPKQLEEYELREDQDYRNARGLTRHCDLTADEFRKLVRLGDHRVFNSGATRADQDRLRQRLSGILPPEKIESYLQGIDLTYQFAVEATERLELPREIALEVWRLKQDALNAAHAIQQDSAASPDARQRTLAEIVERTEREMRVRLGDDGFTMIRRDWPWWKQLRNP